MPVANLRSRLLLLALVAFLPMLGLMIYTGFEARRRAATESQAAALAVARFAAVEQHQLIEGARQLLVGLSQLPEVANHDGARCSALFAEIRSRFPAHANLGAAAPNGDIFCSALPTPGPVNIADRPYFQRAVHTREFAVGNFLIGRVSGRPGLPLGYPVIDSAGTLRAVLFVSLDVVRLNHLATDAQLPTGSMLTVLDRDGVVLARYPTAEAWVGKAVPDVSLVRAVLTGREEGTTEARGLDGERRLYAFHRLPVPRDAGDLYIAVGIPTAVAFAEANRTLGRNILGLVVTSLLILAAVWLGGDLFILRGVRALLQATTRLGTGDLSARTGLPYAGELGQLAHAFDEMATTLEKREAERRGAGQALEQSATNFRFLFANNPLTMWVYDLDTLAFLEVNAAAIEHYGYSRAEFLSMRLVDIRPPEDVTKLEAVVSDFTAGAVRHTGVWRHRTKGGRIISVDIISHSMAFSGRRAVLVVAIDVTDLKAAEAALAKYTERLELLHKIDLAVIAEETPVALAAAVVPRLRELLGVPRAIVNLFDWQAGEVEWLAAAGRRRVRTGPSIRFPLALMGDVDVLRRGELQVIDVDTLPRSPEAQALLGSGVHVYMVVPMIASGELIGALSFGGAMGQFQSEQVSIAQEVAAQLAIAITQARLHERVRQHAAKLEQAVHDRTLELQQHKERLEDEVKERTGQLLQTEKLAAMGNLLAGVAHELNNPMSVILGQAGLLHARTGEAWARERAEKIEVAAQRCARIVKNFLSLARQRSVEYQACGLNRIVTEAVELVGYPLRLDDVTVRLSLDPDLPELWADPHQLGQVIVNLITNAHQAMRETTGARILTITSGLDASPGSVFAEIADSGPGVPRALREKIFEPFFTTKPPGEGTGLGLHLCRTTMQDHQGSLRVVDRPGHGAVFRVELPLGAGEAAPTNAGAARGSVSLANRSVLVVDDEPSIAEMLSDMLSHAGAQVETASNGLEALARIEGGATYDAILSDLRMPQLDGPGFYREVLRCRPELGARIIFMTGDALSPHIGRFLETVATPRVNKPFSSETVLRVVHDTVTGGPVPAGSAA